MILDSESKTKILNPSQRCQVWASAPIFSNGWVLLGEASKWVPVSGARFKDIAYTSIDEDTEPTVSAQMVGAPGEVLEVAWLYKDAPVTVTCTVGTSGGIAMNMKLDKDGKPSGGCV